MRFILALAIPLLALLVAARAAMTPATAPAETPIVAATSPSTAPDAGTTVSVWEGVYSSQQAARGEKGYNSSCARCHGDTLLGNDDAPALVEKEFLDRWESKSMANLVELTQKKMPTDGPGKLSRKLCTDISAYVLKANGFPEGKTDLVSDPEVLGRIIITTKK